MRGREKTEGGDEDVPQCTAYLTDGKKTGLHGEEGRSARNEHISV